MRLIDQWNLFMKEIPSPQSYIDWGFYYLISAALQRHVWLGPKLNFALYPNMYVILTGEPAVGKGLVIKPIADILAFHKLDTSNHKPIEPIREDAREVNGAVVITPEKAEEYNRQVAEALGLAEQQRSSTPPEKPLLIPVAADATTFEALVRALARAKRLASYKELDILANKEIVKNETHSSICFCLEEISSLFRKHTEDLVNFLIRTYDCGDYKYDTKTQGTDTIRRCCVNLFGGTTPGFIRRIFSDELITEGFASRAVFVFEFANRFNRLLIPDFSIEQLAGREAIIRHIKQLTKIHGSVKMTDDALAFLTHWWCMVNPVNRPNNSLKLNPYYGRKNIHVQKLAMSIHFADSLDMVIEKSECEEALAILDATEKKMHNAVTLDNKNPLSGIAKDIKKFITRNGPQDKIALLVEFYGEGRDQEIMEALQYLIQTGQVNFIPAQGKDGVDKYGC